MEYLKNILIKEAIGADKVFIVDNLPKSLLYETVQKMVLVPTHAVDYSRYEPKEVKAYIIRDEEMPDEPRNRKLTGEMTDQLLPGIEKSMTGDNGFVFHMEFNEAKERLKAIDAYIRQTLPPLAQVPSRISYAAQAGSFSSPPKPLNQLPRVVLPVAEPVSPPAFAVQISAPAPVQPTIQALAPIRRTRKVRVWTDEQRKAAGDRMRSARMAKLAQQQTQTQPAA